MSPLCNLKSLETPTVIIERVSEIKRIFAGWMAKVLKKTSRRLTRSLSLE